MSDSDLCYKSCGNYIVTMTKLPDTITNESRTGIVDPMHAKFRADKLLVVTIEHKLTGESIKRIQNTSYCHKIWYDVSMIVDVSDYDQDPNEVCSTGIHYFLSREAAFYWDNNIENGPVRAWYSNGQVREEYTLVAGKMHGTCRRWHFNCKPRQDCNYVAGKLHGHYQFWYYTGQKRRDCHYINDKLHGHYQSWYQNGEQCEDTIYVNGWIASIEAHG